MIMRPPVTPNPINITIAKRIVRRAIKYSSFMYVRVVIIGLRIAPKPRIRPMLAIFEPMIVPVAILMALLVGSIKLVNPDIREIVSSGRDVAMATIVRPISNCDRPHKTANREAYFVIQSAPFSRRIRPATKIKIWKRGMGIYRLFV